VRWLPEADDNPDSHKNLITAFCPIYNVPWNLHADSFRGIALSRQINKPKGCENN